MKKQKEESYKGRVVSLEDMKKLEDMGIDTSDASCIWHSYTDEKYNPKWWMPIFRSEDIKIEKLREAYPKTYAKGNIYYCYTLDDIVRKLPVITIREKDDDSWNGGVNYSPYVMKDYACYLNVNKGVYHYENGESTVEAAYKLFVWAKENGHL